MSSGNIQQKRKLKKLPTFNCDTCQKSFVTKQLLQKHLYSGKCNLDKNFQCDICTKWVKTKYSLDQHMSKYHYDPSVLLDCPYQNCNRKCGNNPSKDILTGTRILKKKERQKILEEQKRHKQELERAAKKRQISKATKSSPAKVVPGSMLTPDFPEYKDRKSKKPKMK